MPVLKINLEGPENFTPIPDGAIVHHTVEPIEVALLMRGMQSGKPSVMFRIELGEGVIAIVETSYELFQMAANVMKARVESTS